MSKVVKGIKKVFRSVVKVVKKIWKPLVIAAAVYFTAGAAMSYFGAAGATAGVTGATAAAGAGAAGGTAASAAAAIHGAAATMGATTMAAGTTLGGALAGTSVSAVASAAAAAGQAIARGAYTRTAMSMAAGKPAIPAAINAATTPPASTSLLSRVGTAVRGMEGYERAMYVQTLISGVSGLLAPKPPTPDQTAQANARFRGSYFGVGEDGKQEFDPVASYNQFWKPRAGESYRGAMPDNRDTQPPASPAAANALASGSGGRLATGQSGASTHNKQQAPSFIQGDDNADGNAGYYSPDDSYT